MRTHLIHLVALLIISAACGIVTLTPVFFPMENTPEFMNIDGEFSIGSWVITSIILSGILIGFFEYISDMVSGEEMLLADNFFLGLYIFLLSALIFELVFVFTHANFSSFA